MRKSIVLLLVMLFLIAIPASGQDASSLVWGFPADVTTFNPITQIEAQDSAAQGLVFPALYMRNMVTGIPEPYLTSWEVSDDGLTYTFTVHADAVWSDGTPITSNDVVFTLNSVFSDNVETFRTINGVESINIVDDKVFEIVLTQPTCGLFGQIGMPILPAHKYAADYSDFMTSEFNNNPDVSGGPFVLTERAVDEYLRFTANDTFFLGRPQFDQYLLQVIVDPQVRIQAMESGAIDFVTGLTNDQVRSFVDNPNFTLHPVEANGWVMGLFNLADPANPQPSRDADGNLVEQTPHPILGDPLVRQALVQGWDHEDGVFIMGEGTQRLVGPVPPVLPDAYNNDLELYAYDPDAAAALLDEAGWVLNGDVREKDGVPMSLDIAYITPFDDLAAVIADYWTSLGVDVTLTTGERGVMIGETLAPQVFDVFVISASWTEPSPDVLLNFFYNSANDFGTNFSSFVNEEFDGLLTELATAGCDPADRQPLYYRLQEIAHEVVPSDFISTLAVYNVTSARIGEAAFSAWGGSPVWEWTVTD